MSQIIIISNNHETYSGRIQTAKDPAIGSTQDFFWVSYDVSHEFKTRAEKIFREENFERVSRTAITIVQNAIVGQV